MKKLLLLVLLCFMIFVGCDMVSNYHIQEKSVFTDDINTRKNMKQPSLNNMAKELDDNLCMPNEELIYSFKLSNSEKKVTIAISELQDYLVCRTGTQDNVELEFPAEKNKSWDQFSYNYYRRGGGIENLALSYDELIFQTDTSEYTILYEISAVSDRESESQVCLIITDKESIDKKGKSDAIKIVTEGDLDSIKGNIDKLLDSKIKKNFG